MQLGQKVRGQRDPEDLRDIGDAQLFRHATGEWHVGLHDRCGAFAQVASELEATVQVLDRCYRHAAPVRELCVAGDIPSG